MKVLKSHEKVLACLFDSDENLLRTDDNPKGLSVAQLDIKKRCLIIYSRKLEDPLIADKVLIEELKNQFDVENWTLYNDIRAVEHFFLGSFKRANKEYVRFMVNEAQKKALSHEINHLEKADIKKEYFDTANLSKASKVLGDINNLDKEDSGIDPSQFQQIPTEFTSDVTELDIEDIGDEKAAQLKQKYEKKGIQEAEIIEDDE